jgi:predicted RNase H-like nuclease (RuvC/YqgF family)
LENLRKSLENETDLRIAEIGRRKELEEKVSEMENRVGEKDLEIEKLGRKIEQIDRESRMMTDEITQKVNKELFEEKAKVERFSRDLESKDLEIKKLLNASDELSRLKAENEELKKKLTSAMRDTKASSCGCLLF